MMLTHHLLCFNELPPHVMFLIVAPTATMKTRRLRKTMMGKVPV
jgi:hypothetical protein